MSEAFTPDELGSTPTIEVTVYRDGELVHRELCETETDASAVVEQWSEFESVVCQIDDLSVHHRSTDVLEPTESVMPDDDRRTGPDAGG
ncbi:MAG: hypothetical protein ACXVJ7_16765 [Acidimicrobiia bacterium]